MSQTPTEDDLSAYVDEASAYTGVPIPDHCRPGVIANLKTLYGFAQLVMDFPLDEQDQPPPAFRP